MRFTPQDEEFRAEVRAWLEASLTGEFAGLRGAGGPGREHERHDERLAWNRHLAAAGWTCLGWPAEHGGRGYGYSYGYGYGYYGQHSSTKRRRRFWRGRRRREASSVVREPSEYPDSINVG